MAMSLGAYSYVGVEIPAVTAVEAILNVDPAEASQPANAALKVSVARLPWMVSMVYFVAGLMVSLNVKYNDSALQPPAWVTGATTRDLSRTFDVCKPSSAFIVSAQSVKSGWRVDLMFTAFFMITAWSAANTVLYVSSRTLFGLTRHYAQVRDWTKSEYWLGLLGRTSHGAQVPLNAMLFSILVFMWVPYLQLTDQDSALNVRKNTRRGYAACRLRTDERILGCQCAATPWFSLVRYSLGVRMPCFHPIPSLVCKRLSLMYVSIRLLNSCPVSRSMASPKTRKTTCRIYCARATTGELDTHGYRLTSPWQRI
jgi:hypothetical protein